MWEAFFWEMKKIASQQAGLHPFAGGSPPRVAPGIKIKAPAAPKFPRQLAARPIKLGVLPAPKVKTYIA